MGQGSRRAAASPLRQRLGEVILASHHFFTEVSSYIPEESCKNGVFLRTGPDYPGFDRVNRVMRSSSGVCGSWYLKRQNHTSRRGFVYATLVGWPRQPLLLLLAYCSPMLRARA